MAKRTTHLLIDDIDGAELDTADGVTVDFGIDGATYVIDLSHANAEQLRQALALYIRAGRRLAAPVPKPRRTSSAPSRTDEIRTWARANGYTVSDRGRIPYAVITAYDAA